MSARDLPAGWSIRHSVVHGGQLMLYRGDKIMAHSRLTRYGSPRSTRAIRRDTRQLIRFAHAVEAAISDGGGGS